MTRVQRKLATEKTKFILLTRKRILLEIDITICDTTLTTQIVVNYFGIRLNLKLTIWEEIQYNATKVAKVTFLLSKLKDNICGPGRSRCRLMMAIIEITAVLPRQKH